MAYSSLFSITSTDPRAQAGKRAAAENGISDAELGAGKINQAARRIAKADRKKRTATT